ncbi:ATP-binding cassette domain-containing protein [Pseudactinotalea terrae]|uniref:ATP-binding cassette domain-containing protein n=1 Tax=Pseudactinotalea terrae TaxID=1743262 RepID=UPI0012E29225|nr:ATP-binding cassette domain-containing protein [Pseudactinotalea terrae]
MSTLQVRDLTVRTPQGRRLLTGIDLDVDPGERVLVVGPSGSGKSTLLRVIAGLDPAPGGSVTGSVAVADRQVLGHDHTQDREPLDVGWLPQDPAAGVCLPVIEDDVAFGCENRAWPVPRIAQAVRGALTAVGGWQWRRRDSGTLSAGQAQRVGLAAALAPDPALLLLDEPTALLDPGALRGVQAIVSGLAGPAVLLVEHRLDEWADAGALPDRVVALEGGRVVADGPAEQVWVQVGPALAQAGCHLPWEVEQTLAVPDGESEPPPSGSPGWGSPRASLMSGRGLAAGRDEVVLSEVDLEVRAGEVVAVIGANGSGKSTLLHTLAGELRLLAGTLARPGGRPALVLGDAEQQFLAQTVLEELALDGDDAEAAAAELRLDPSASVHRLSGGEQRRLSLATVLRGGRAVVLADEPTHSLDRAGVRWTMRALREAARAGRGVLLTSHDLRFVLEVADRVHVVHEGRLLGGGATAEVLAGDLPALAGLPLPASVRAAVREAAA